MILTVVGAYKGHYPKEFSLTPSQRTLMLQTIGFMMYLLLGALVFSKVEGWHYLDAVYWADFTLLTIGIGGEYVPKTHTGRSLLFPFAIGGIVMVGLVIGSIRSLVLERGKQKISARFMEMKRQSVISSLDDDKKTIRIGFLEKVSFSGKGLSEMERREKEFEVMRRIQEKSERNRRYFSLVLSTIAALLLWFMGAVVFMHAERPQGWTYFVSLYFAYTSLLTIGYGDYTLSSNSGKAFFVFWSLLAVPTLTILISNMGDTVIKTFKDFTIWLGSITVLPGEHGPFHALKSGIKGIARRKLTEDETQHKKKAGNSTDPTINRLVEHVEEEELGEAEDASQHGDTLERDIHFYHFILAKEIRQLMRDLDASPPKQYTYGEWSYYLRLIGQNEADASGHRKPKVHSDNMDGEEPELGLADGTAKGQESNKWSWLGIRSPLMGEKSEAQWIFERLALTLERELKKMGSQDANDKRPPISMADLKKLSSSSGNDVEQQEDVNAAEVRRRQQNR
jgi:potassium channel subfamily K